MSPGLERRPAWRRAMRLSGRIAVVMVIGVPVLAVTAAGAGLGALAFGDLAGTIPEPKPSRRLEPSRVYLTNADGSRGPEIASFREFELALPMRREDVPKVLKDAVIAAEDRQFWSHKGIDPVGIARAAYIDLSVGAPRQGASTITQQVVREKYLTREQTFERKFNEVLLATRYEREQTDRVTAETGMTGEDAEREAKERILFEYLSRAYFGGGTYGAAAAAESYFHKPVRDLTLSEAAALVGMLPSPTASSPRQNIVLAEERRREVLRSMREAGVISEPELIAAIDRPLWWSGFGDPPRPMTVVHPPPRVQNDRYPYVVDHIRRYIEDRYGPDRLHHGGLEIHASVDPRMQESAEASVAATLKGSRSPLEMSLVAVEPATGLVRALVGGRDFNSSQVNLALSGFPAGSAFKGFTVAAALEQGVSPSAGFYAPEGLVRAGCQGGCVIENAVAGESGFHDMYRATAMSINTWFVLLIERVGVDNVVELAHRLGVRPRIDPKYGFNYQLTLGKNEVSPLEMAAGYAVFANRGVKADPTPVVRVVDPDGRVLEDNSAPHGTPVMNPTIADWTTQVLRGPIERGTASGSVRLDRVAAGKTGTIDGHTNAWFVGYTPQLAAAAWIGHSDGLYRIHLPGEGDVFGAGAPARTWNAFMNTAVAGMPVQEFTEPGPLPGPGEAVVPLPGETLVEHEVYAPAPAAPRFGEVPADCAGPCVVPPNVSVPPASPARPVPPTPPPPAAHPAGAGATTPPTTRGTP